MSETKLDADVFAAFWDVLCPGIRVTNADYRHYAPAIEAAVLRAERPGWRAMERAPKGMKVLLGYANRLGKWRTILGCYYEEGTLESHHEESGFAPPGWYEDTEAYDEISLTDQNPTAWQPLPDPPALHPSVAEGRGSEEKI